MSAPLTIQLAGLGANEYVEIAGKVVDDLTPWLQRLFPADNPPASTPATQPATQYTPEQLAIAKAAADKAKADASARTTYYVIGGLALAGIAVALIWKRR
jgi:hypothetical protein